jgi:putative endonuclease
MKWFAYILQSKSDGRLYKGMAKDPEKRLIGHNKGDTKSTKGYRPWILLHKEEFESRIEARKREEFFKSGSGREWIKENLDP